MISADGPGGPADGCLPGPGCCGGVAMTIGSTVRTVTSTFSGLPCWSLTVPMIRYVLFGVEPGAARWRRWRRPSSRSRLFGLYSDRQNWSVTSTGPCDDLEGGRRGAATVADRAGWTWGPSAC